MAAAGLAATGSPQTRMLLDASCSIVPQLATGSRIHGSRYRRGAAGRYALRMTHRRPFLVALVTLLSAAIACRTTPEAPASGAAIDRDLLEVTVPQLHRLYAEKKYTVTQVVQWHLDRIDRYNGVYGAIETVFRREALAEAAREDAEAATGEGARG